MRNPLERANAMFFERLNKVVDWHDLPTPAALLNLRAFRDELRQANLYDTEAPPQVESNGAEAPVPLEELPPHRRALFARTLLEYMKCRDNAVDAAARLMVHDQTVRYRARRLKALMGEEVNDPRRRTELLLLLNAVVELDLIGTGTGPPEPA